MATLPHPAVLQTEIPSQSAANDYSLQPARAPRREKLTIALLRSLQPGDLVRDTEVPGLYAEAGARGVSLKVVADVAQRQRGSKGKTVRKTFGRFPALDLTEARSQARRLLAEVRAGNDPRPQPEPAPAVGGKTLAAALEDYLAKLRRNEKAPTTIKYTEKRVRKHLASLLNRPIASLTTEDCRAAHDRISASGPVGANKTLRDLRTIWRNARRIATDPAAFPNVCPVEAVDWHPEKPRNDRVISDLAAWWRKVTAIKNPARRAMHRLGLLSGLRPGNLAGMRREWIHDLDDPARARVEFPAEAMKARLAFTLPLSPPMVELVRTALELGNSVAANGGGLVFPTWPRNKAPFGTPVPMTWSDPLLDASECGHGLRRTYRTLAVAAGAAASDVELLIAHTLPKVQRAYLNAAHSAVESHLREVQSRISGFILEACGVTAADVAK